MLKIYIYTFCNLLYDKVITSLPFSLSLKEKEGEKRERTVQRWQNVIHFFLFWINSYIHKSMCKSFQTNRYVFCYEINFICSRFLSLNVAFSIKPGFDGSCFWSIKSITILFLQINFLKLLTLVLNFDFDDSYFLISIHKICIIWMNSEFKKECKSLKLKTKHNLS